MMGKGITQQKTNRNSNKLSQTQQKISQDLEISPSTFSQYMNGWKKMPNELKIQVAEYLQIEQEKQEKLFEEEK